MIVTLIKLSKEMVSKQVFWNRQNHMTGCVFTWSLLKRGAEVPLIREFERKCFYQWYIHFPINSLCACSVISSCAVIFINGIEPDYPHKFFTGKDMYDK